LVFKGTEFTSAGLENGERVGSVTLVSDGAKATALIGSYTITPSAATGGTFNISNYTITYMNGTLAVNTALTDQVLVAMQNIQYYNPPDDINAVRVAVADNTPLPAEQSETAGQGSNSGSTPGTSQGNQPSGPKTYSSHQQNDSQPESLLGGSFLYADSELIKRFQLEYLAAEKINIIPLWSDR
jgi:hypothetical protein